MRISKDLVITADDGASASLEDLLISRVRECGEEVPDTNDVADHIRTKLLVLACEMNRYRYADLGH